MRSGVASGSDSDPRRTHCENGQCCIQRGNQGRREDGERVQGEDARFCEDSMLVIFSRSRCSCVTSANRRQLFTNHKEPAFGLTSPDDLVLLPSSLLLDLRDGDRKLLLKADPLLGPLSQLVSLSFRCSSSPSAPFGPCSFSFSCSSRRERPIDQIQGRRLGRLRAGGWPPSVTAAGTPRSLATDDCSGYASNRYPAIVEAIGARTVPLVACSLAGAVGRSP